MKQPSKPKEGSPAHGNFAVGSVAGNILQLAVPMTFAQLINVLYQVVDRMYIGRIPNAASDALTGVGLTFPILLMITAFANLFGAGGAPLFSIARGKGDVPQAEAVMGNSFGMLALSGFVLTTVFLLGKKPLLYLFGASDVTFPYANGYITIYLFGTLFVMLGLGMNNFINAQGLGRKGMMTVLLGAVINIALDPLFIFVFQWGVHGAAFATVLSQMVSACWALFILTGKKVAIRLKIGEVRLRISIIKRIVLLGFSTFIMAITNSLVQIACNATLQQFGGDLYVGVMTIINSVREIVSTPINGLTQATQPVLGYNYGARQYARVRTGIKFMTAVCVVLTTTAWLCLFFFPQFFIRLFSSDPALEAVCIPSMHIYFFGFFMMSLQMAGQTSSVGLGKSKQAIFFSLLRKAVIVVPLTLLLPHLFGLGVNGVFLAEPISNFIGGGACYITMLLTTWKELKQDPLAVEGKARETESIPGR